MNGHFKHYGVLVALALFAGLAFCTYRAAAASAKYYSPVYPRWTVNGPDGGKYAADDNYEGGLNDEYPQFVGDIVPATTVTICVDTGMTLVNSKLVQYGWRGSYGNKPVPKINKIIKGDPTRCMWWTALRVSEGYRPRWIFKVQGQPGQCLTATYHIKYWKRVNGHRRLVLVPHAQSQNSAQMCLPQSSTTTTTG